MFLVNGQYGGGIGKDAFREEEADGEVRILAGGTHGHGDVLAAAGVGGAVFETDLQWLFYGDGVFCLNGSLVWHDLLHWQAGDAGLWYRSLDDGEVEHISNLRNWSCKN